ncbi:hypothetical protein JCM10213_008037 [Rhodosporidiobolus nylandii]
MASGDPNFPEHLRIAPSSRSTVRVAGAGGAELDDGEDAAQDIETFGIAGRTWEAAYLLRHYLSPPSALPSPPTFDPPCPLFSPPASHLPTPSPSRSPSPTPRQRRTILELGSGTGFLSLALAPHLQEGDTLVLTDLENVCPLLEKNLETARGRWRARGVFPSPPAAADERSVGQGEPALLVRPLPWGDPAALARLVAEGLQPDVILASDLIYFPFLYPLLLRTLIGLTQQGGVKLLFSYKVRSLVKEQPFWEAFGRWFSLTPVQLGVPVPPSSPPSPAPSLTWTRFGAHTPSSTSSNPNETDELYIFVCERWPSTLPGSPQAGAAEDIEQIGDEELMQGRGSAKGYEQGAGQFEEMLLLQAGWDSD